LEPSSKRSSFQAASQYLEPPSYALHDSYRAMSTLAEECDFIQSEVYKNSFFFGKRSDRVLYYDCTNYYFEIEQEDGDEKYGKSKEHRPNPIIQMGLFTDGDGIPLAFSLFPGNSNEQTSLKPLEKKILQDMISLFTAVTPGLAQKQTGNSTIWGSARLLSHSQSKSALQKKGSGLWNGPVLNVFRMKALQT
jgi:hypothetical protein